MHILHSIITPDTGSIAVDDLNSLGQLTGVKPETPAHSPTPSLSRQHERLTQAHASTTLTLFQPETPFFLQIYLKSVQGGVWGLYRG